MQIKMILTQLKWGGEEIPKLWNSTIKSYVAIQREKTISAKKIKAILNF